MEEEFFRKRLTKKKAVLKGITIIIIDFVLFDLLNNLHNYENIPLMFILAIIGFAIFIYGIYTLSLPFNYENCKDYVEKQGFEISATNEFLYKNYLIKWGKNGAYVYQKNGIARWVIHDVVFNNEEEVKDFLKNKPERDKIFDAIPNSAD